MEDLSESCSQGITSVWTTDVSTCSTEPSILYGSEMKGSQKAAQRDGRFVGAAGVITYRTPQVLSAAGAYLSRFGGMHNRIREGMMRGVTYAQQALS